MAAPLVKTVPVQLRQPGTIGQDFDVPARPAGTLKLEMQSPDWLTTPGLTMTYRSRKSTDGGTTWVDAGALTATSPTFAKDGVTQVAPGGQWNWDGVAGILQVEATTVTAYTWGLRLTLADA